MAKEKPRRNIILLETHPGFHDEHKNILQLLNVLGMVKGNCETSPGDLLLQGPNVIPKSAKPDLILSVHKDIAEFTEKLRPLSSSHLSWQEKSEGNIEINDSRHTSFSSVLNSPGQESIEDPYSSTFDEILDFEEQSLLSSPGSIKCASSMDLLFTSVDLKDDRKLEDQETQYDKVEACADEPSEQGVNFHGAFMTKIAPEYPGNSYKVKNNTIGSDLKEENLLSNVKRTLVKDTEAKSAGLDDSSEQSKNVDVLSSSLTGREYPVDSQDVHSISTETDVSSETKSKIVESNKEKSKGKPSFYEFFEQSNNVIAGTEVQKKSVVNFDDVNRERNLNPVNDETLMEELISRPAGIPMVENVGFSKPDVSKDKESIVPTYQDQEASSHQDDFIPGMSVNIDAEAKRTDVRDGSKPEGGNQNANTIGTMSNIQSEQIFKNHVRNTVQTKPKHEISMDKCSEDLLKKDDESAEVKVTVTSVTRIQMKQRKEELLTKQHERRVKKITNLKPLNETTSSGVNRQLPLSHQMSENSNLHEVLLYAGTEPTLRPLESINRTADVTNEKDERTIDNTVLERSRKSFSEKRAVFKQIQSVSSSDSVRESSSNVLVDKAVIINNTDFQKLGSLSTHSNQDTKLFFPVLREDKELIGHTEELNDLTVNIFDEVFGQIGENSKTTTDNQVIKYNFENIVPPDEIVPPIPPMPISYESSEDSLTESQDVLPAMLETKQLMESKKTTFEQRREKELDDILHALQETVQKMEEDCIASFSGPQNNLLPSNTREINKLDVPDNFGNLRPCDNRSVMSL